MRFILLFLIFLVKVNAEESSYVKGYQNNLVEVELIGYGERSKNEYLIRISGYDHEDSGKVFLYKKVVTNPARNLYKLCMNDHKKYKNWCTFHVENGGWGSTITKIFPPGLNKEQIVYLMKKENSKKIDRNSIIGIYLKNKAKIN